MRLLASALAAICVLVLLGASAPVAAAATTTVASGVLQVQAASGEANEIQVAREGAEVVVRDAGRLRMVGAGCRARATRVVACTAAGLTAISIQAGDEDDSVRVLDPLAATITGGAGADSLSGGPGDDDISGASGADVIDGGGGADQLSGGSGVDLLAGGIGADVLRGGVGDDDLNGEDGDDTLSAGSGDDLMDGGLGADRLSGEQGADSLRGGAGVDLIDGGEGGDTIAAADGEVDTVSCGDGADSGEVDPADVSTDCEKLRGPTGSPLTTEPAALTPLTPFPLVRVVGTVNGSRTRLTRVLVDAPKGVRIESRCSGRGCPYKTRVTTLPAGGGRVALRGLQRSLRSGVVFEVFVTQAGRIGKYARFAIRRGRAPGRTDRCLLAEARRPVDCAS